MCVILDASARDSVFGTNRTVAGRQFFEWLETQGARMIVGGKLTQELENRSAVFSQWAETAIADGRLRRIADQDVAREIERLSAGWSGLSNDQHVIALARISKARILFANDTELCKDFRNRELLPGPRGRVPPAGDSQNATNSRKRLLRQTHLCPHR